MDRDTTNENPACSCTAQAGVPKPRTGFIGSVEQSLCVSSLPFISCFKMSRPPEGRFFQSTKERKENSTKSRAILARVHCVYYLATQVLNSEKLPKCRSARNCVRDWLCTCGSSSRREAHLREFAIVSYSQYADLYDPGGWMELDTDLPRVLGGSRSLTRMAPSGGPGKLSALVPVKL